MARRTSSAALRVVAPDEKAQKQRKPVVGVALPPARPVEPDWSFWLRDGADPAEDTADARSEASAEWSRVVDELDRAGLLSTVDLTILVDHCVVKGRLLCCERNISREGMWQEGERGTMKNPATTVAGQLRTQLRYTANALLLTPASRVKVRGSGGGSSEGEDNPFDA